MDLGSAARVLLRRWLVLVIGLVLTLGAGAYIYTHSPPRYQATARMLLLLPADARVVPGEAGSRNSPFLYLPDGLQVLAGIVATTPNSRAFNLTMTAAGLTSQYEVGIDTATPTITISVEGSDAENVIATRDRIITGVQDELLTVQRDENTPQRQLAHARVYAVENTPDLVQGDRTRGTLTALGVGGLITLLTAFLVDRAIQLRQERRQRQNHSPRTDAAGEPGGSTDEYNFTAAPIQTEVAVGRERHKTDTSLLSQSPEESLESSEDARTNGRRALDADQLTVDIERQVSVPTLAEAAGGAGHHRAELAATDPVDREEQQLVVGIHHEEPPRAATETQRTDDEQVSDDEQWSDDEQPVVGAKAGDTKHPPEPELMPYPPPEEKTMECWDLYSLEYPPVNGGPALPAEDDHASEHFAGNGRGANGLIHDGDEGSRSLEEELAHTDRAPSRA
jgi:capsular polysaccharide biosynthesis protein